MDEKELEEVTGGGILGMGLNSANFYIDNCYKCGKYRTTDCPYCGNYTQAARDIGNGKCPYKI